MQLNLKTKLSFGLSFLFVVILLFGGLGIFYISKLKVDANRIIQNNHETLVYTNNMLKAIDSGGKDSLVLIEFEKNLKKQEANITEKGEKEATGTLRQHFNQWKINSNNQLTTLLVADIRQINELNQNAIQRKNEVAQNTADNAILVLSVLFTILTLVTFTFVVNFPEIISKPVKALSEGISAIANKQYDKRIHLEQKDEFGELANAFNSMAEKLDAYEHSNLAKITFEKSRIETIINQMKDGIIGFDEKNKILFLNRVAENLLGFKETEILGKYGPDLAIENDLMRKLLQEEQVSQELKIYADNKESYFNKDVFNVTNQDNLIGRVIVLRNITPFHELNEAKTNFIATVSHELKTPIASIKMGASLLLNEKTGACNPEQKDLIKSILEDSNRLLKITGELLNISQVETGNLQLKLQPFNPKLILANAIQTVQFQAQQKHLVIKIDAEETNSMALGDPEKTTWVLNNLLTNAVKYSLENSFIETGFRSSENHVLFFIRDYGRGIEAKYLPRIFERYFKVPGTIDRTGTGLGLAISKEFIEAQQGTIWVESSIGEGSNFQFTLPIAKKS